MNVFQQDDPYSEQPVSRGISGLNTQYAQVVKISSNFFRDGEEPTDVDLFVQKTREFLERIHDTNTVVGIFSHKTWASVVEVGAEEFWGMLTGSHEERVKMVLSHLEKEYKAFPVESVKWLIHSLNDIPYEQRVNIKIHHCGIRYRMENGKRICLFSQSIPLHYDQNRYFNYTFSHVQNVFHLMKPSFKHYWIRMSYGPQNEFVRTYLSSTSEYASHDLLSVREKEILSCIAAGLPTKAIADQLFISPNTVSNHRSNMVERLGVRDTTALVQVAKMAGMI